MGPNELRKLAEIYDVNGGDGDNGVLAATLRQAATEIERLRESEEMTGMALVSMESALEQSKIDRLAAMVEALEERCAKNWAHAEIERLAAHIKTAGEK